ncbi:globin family protein [Acaryochloris sp. IP29b_bin.148]|uniref:globin family protein n=1 Tax=Acaryochloris sp. IP29b_bin.148 TaxID=2969218 RepID=UPI00262F7753|nr:globin family protein [Acaryochloris sp. IP29b_bin.148]
MTPIQRSASPPPQLNAKLLEDSFDKVRPHADAFSVKFYENLFADYPAAKPLFANTSIEKQGSKLFSSLVLVISNIKYPEGLATDLQGLGARHVEYGALPEHYPLVGQTLLKTLSQFLKEDWTTELQNTWADAYAIITEMMLEGADYAPQDIQLNSAVSSEPAQPTADIEQLTAEGLQVFPILTGVLGILGTIALIVILI